MEHAPGPDIFSGIPSYFDAFLQAWHSALQSCVQVQDTSHRFYMRFLVDAVCDFDCDDLVACLSCLSLGMLSSDFGDCFDFVIVEVLV